MWKLANSLKTSTLCEQRGIVLNHIIQNAEKLFTFRSTRVHFSSSNFVSWKIGDHFSNQSKKNISIICPRISHDQNTALISATDLSRSFSLLHCERINNKAKDFLYNGSLLLSSSRNCDTNLIFKSGNRNIYLSKIVSLESTEKKSETVGMKSEKRKGDENETEKDKSLSGDNSVPKTETVAADNTVSKKSLLKQAVKDYGATVIVFHVAMSLCSLGICYGLISSGLDVVEMLKNIGVGESILQSKITQGASTFVIAYAVHKVFAPVRITITLTATPLIVRKLRAVGILKKPIQK